MLDDDERHRYEKRHTDRQRDSDRQTEVQVEREIVEGGGGRQREIQRERAGREESCLLYTSDAADDC